MDDSFVILQSKYSQFRARGSVICVKNDSTPPYRSHIVVNDYSSSFLFQFHLPFRVEPILNGLAGLASSSLV